MKPYIHVLLLRWFRFASRPGSIVVKAYCYAFSMLLCWVASVPEIPEPKSTRLPKSKSQAAASPVPGPPRRPPPQWPPISQLWVFGFRAFGVSGFRGFSTHTRTCLGEVSSPKYSTYSCTSRTLTGLTLTAVYLSSSTAHSTLFVPGAYSGTCIARPHQLRTQSSITPCVMHMPDLPQQHESVPHCILHFMQTCRKHANE